MKNCLWIVLTISLFFIQGCAGVQCPEFSEDIITRLDLKDAMSGIADELSCKPESAEITCKALTGTVIITDFVDIQSLKPGKPGILLSEMMKSRLFASADIRVAQVEFSKYFTLTPDGLVGLTRNSREILKDEYANSECIVGTYSLAPQQLFLFVRRIDMKTGKIIKMADRTISWSCSQGFRFNRSMWPDDIPVSISTTVR